MGNNARVLQQLVGSSLTLENIVREQHDTLWPSIERKYSDPASNVEVVRQSSWPFLLERDVVWRGRTILELSSFAEPKEKQLSKNELVRRAEREGFEQLLGSKHVWNCDCDNPGNFLGALERFDVDAQSGALVKLKAQLSVPVERSRLHDIVCPLLDSFYKELPKGQCGHLQP